MVSDSLGNRTIANVPLPGEKQPARWSRFNAANGGHF